MGLKITFQQNLTGETHMLYMLNMCRCYSLQFRQLNASYIKQHQPESAPILD